MDAKTLLSMLGNTFHIVLEFNERNVCSASFDDDDVDFEIAGNDLFLIADAGFARDDQELFKKLLAANLRPNELSGAYFAFDETYESIILLRKLPCEMDYDEFEQQLAGFLNVLRSWKQKVAGDDAPGDAVPPQAFNELSA